MGGLLLKLSKAQLQIKIKRILDSTSLSQCGWEGHEDIVLFNDKPIGATISNRNLELGRWWPDLKIHIAEYIANELSKK
jgi:hypothetical protein